MYVKIVDNAIVEQGLPLSARRLDTSEWVMGIHDAPVELQQACGYFLVDESAPKPADTATTTFNPIIAVVNGFPVLQWVEVPKSARQLEIEQRTASENNYKTQARTAINTLQAMRDDANVTNAEAVQYIKQLALINQHLIRLIVREDLLD